MVIQIQKYTSKVEDQTIVDKVLHKLNSKFNHVVSVIEQSKDMSSFSFDELMGSQQAHEVTFNQNVEKV